jgi:hypothetical protein
MELGHISQYSGLNKMVATYSRPLKYIMSLQYNKLHNHITNGNHIGHLQAFSGHKNINLYL